MVTLDEARLRIGAPEHPEEMAALEERIRQNPELVAQYRQTLTDAHAESILTQLEKAVTKLFTTEMGERVETDMHDILYPHGAHVRSLKSGTTYAGIDHAARNISKVAFWSRPGSERYREAVGKISATEAELASQVEQRRESHDEVARRFCLYYGCHLPGHPEPGKKAPPTRDQLIAGIGEDKYWMAYIMSAGYRSPEADTVARIQNIGNAIASITGEKSLTSLRGKKMSDVLRFVGQFRKVRQLLLEPTPVDVESRRTVASSGEKPDAAGLARRLSRPAGFMASKRASPRGPNRRGP